jgi:L-rhamnose-H+ transport protein
MVKGLLLTLLAGMMNASFPLPMRYMRKWAWENIWTVWSVVALFLLPWCLAFLTVSHLGSVYRSSGVNALALSALFGLLWGIAGFLFGLSVELVGMSLTFAVVNGLSSAIGSWIPLVVQHPGSIASRGGLIVSAGVLGVVGGVGICSWAGRLRSKGAAGASQGEASGAGKVSFGRGLAVAIASGVLAPCLNLGFAFGHKITTAALQAGSSPAAATNAVLAVVLTAGFVSNIAYCLYRLVKNRTARLFSIPETKKFVLLGTIMGTLWLASFAIYGSSTSYLGAYGTVVGWPMLMAIITIASSVLDVAYGDWSKGPLRVMAAGVLLLIGAVATISYGMFCLQQAS